MKVLTLFCAALLFAVSSATASEPAAQPTVPVDPSNPSDALPTVRQPAPETPPVFPQATKPDPALDLMPAQPGQIIPEPTLTPETPGSIPVGSAKPPVKIKTSKTETTEQDLALRIRLRQAKTRALEDPVVQAEWHNSIVARTELQRREALQKYYTRLYADVLKSDARVTKLVLIERDLALRRVQQVRIAPTEALGAPETARRGERAISFTPDQF